MAFETEQIGPATLYRADCLELLATLPTASVHAIVTDPPYSSGTRREGAKGVRKSMNRSTGDDDWFGSDCMTTNGFVWTMRAVATQSKRLLCRGGHFMSFIDWRMSHSLAAAVESADMRYLGMLVWDKVSFGMGAYFRNQHELILHFSHGRTRPVFRRDIANVLSYRRPSCEDHDTEKPVDLMQDLVTTVAGDGEIVADWFMGSGSTGVACVRAGRGFVGCEVDREFFDVSCRKIEQAVATFGVQEKQRQPALFAG